MTWNMSAMPSAAVAMMREGTAQYLPGQGVVTEQCHVAMPLPSPGQVP